MKLKVLFIANTIVSVPFGIGSVLVPHLFLSLFGATLGPAGEVMMQYGGAWLIGLGLLTWLTRNAAESETGRGIARALLVAYLVALAVSVRGQLAGALNVLGWMPVLIQAFFVASLAYLLFARQKAAAPNHMRT
ncbi:MAG: hypothetical protein PVH95_00015 [Anaerolineae bacterium]|jgi:hypothetical protein